MFCYQCEQTFQGHRLHDSWAFAARTKPRPRCKTSWSMPTKGISMYAHRAAQLGARDAEVDRGRDRGPVRHGDERRFRPRSG